MHSCWQRRWSKHVFIGIHSVHILDGYHVERELVLKNDLSDNPCYVYAT